MIIASRKTFDFCIQNAISPSFFYALSSVLLLLPLFVSYVMTRKVTPFLRQVRLNQESFKGMMVAIQAFWHTKMLQGCLLIIIFGQFSYTIIYTFLGAFTNDQNPAEKTFQTSQTIGSFVMLLNCFWFKDNSRKELILIIIPCVIIPIYQVLIVCFNINTEEWTQEILMVLGTWVCDFLMIYGYFIALKYPKQIAKTLFICLFDCLCAGLFGVFLNMTREFKGIPKEWTVPLTVSTEFFSVGILVFLLIPMLWRIKKSTT